MHIVTANPGSQGLFEFLSYPVGFVFTSNTKARPLLLDFLFVCSELFGLRPVLISLLLNNNCKL